MYDSLRAALLATLTIYCWQNAAKSVPQRVTARPLRLFAIAIKKNAEDAPPSIFKVGPEVSWNIQRRYIYRSQFLNSAKSNLLNYSALFPWR
jgi:hypothetical protein